MLILRTCLGDFCYRTLFFASLFVHNLLLICIACELTVLNNGNCCCMVKFVLCVCVCGFVLVFSQHGNL